MSALNKTRSFRLLKHYYTGCVYNPGLDATKIIRCTPVVQKRFFWEMDRKGGYKTAEQMEKVSTVKHIKNGFKELKTELKLFGQELKDLILMDPLLIARPGEVDLLWLFNEPSVLDRFVTTSDSDHNEGYSWCSLSASPAGRGLFHGQLDARVPKDGRIKKAGYCAMRSKRIRVTH